ncbi:hypothetical protein ITP53_13960 [Nonomuraea sp. K274]|uniref:Uncharacterized protein n=1 Tax=Nonomuraea cypriaca TaxID=1187855 RepID=A0A931AA40_9ACTN|nr:hypothetical protein [Nonomuraea cypriaca]MBF8186828.1 hypothetical protein [Nonomuraea cypriaca]
MTDSETQKDVRIEIKMTMSITDVKALQDAAVAVIEREGVWHIGPDATQAQRQEEIAQVRADPAHAVSNLVAFMNIDGLIADRVPGLAAESASVGAKVGRAADFD